MIMAAGLDGTKSSAESEGTFFKYISIRGYAIPSLGPINFRVSLDDNALPKVVPHKY